MRLWHCSYAKSGLRTIEKTKMKPISKVHVCHKFMNLSSGGLIYYSHSLGSKAPPYILDMVSIGKPSHTLRSCNRYLLLNHITHFLLLYMELVLVQDCVYVFDTWSIGARTAITHEMLSNTVLGNLLNLPPEKRGETITHARLTF